MHGASLKQAAVALTLLAGTFGAIESARAVSVDFSNVAFAATGRSQTSTPIGAAEFCQLHRAECDPNTVIVDAVPLTEAKWRHLIAINNSFNTSITPMTDEQLYRVPEFWTYPNGAGDCEDYALAKRHALIENGWPASTLLMTVVRQKNGEGHAVLMVRTDRGDLILDNQNALVQVWTETPYEYLKRQSQADPSRWVSIFDTPTRLASLRS